MNKNIYIIIVTYNGMRWIEKCLNSIPLEHKVVVIDNKSTDNTTSFIQEKFKEVHLIKQVKNLGFGGANNIGISYALEKGADYVFLLNQDAYLEGEVIRDMIKIHQKNKDFAVLSPIQLNGNGTKLDHNFSKYIYINQSIRFDCLKGDFTKEIYKVPFVNAAAWLLPRDTLENIGGFDPIFYHYAEDDNYCHRVYFHDSKVGVVPNMYIFHDREFRDSKRTITYAEKLKIKEREYKHKWANVNIEMNKSIKFTKRSLIKLIFLNLLKVNFRKIKYLIKELILINKIIPEIKRSRQVNKELGCHYL